MQDDFQPREFASCEQYEKRIQHEQIYRWIVETSVFPNLKNFSHWAGIPMTKYGNLVIGRDFYQLSVGQYSDPWGGVISKYVPIFENLGSNTYRRPKAGGMYWLDPKFEKRGTYLLITPSQGSPYSHCNIPKWFSWELRWFNKSFGITLFSDFECRAFQKTLFAFSLCKGRSPLVIAFLPNIRNVVFSIHTNVRT